jgi:metallo-beta-lactamase class B
MRYFLGAHGGYYGLDGKFAHLGKDGFKAFVDAGYRACFAERETAFLRELKRQEQ